MVGSQQIRFVIQHIQNPRQRDRKKEKGIRKEIHFAERTGWAKSDFCEWGKSNVRIGRAASFCSPLSVTSVVGIDWTEWQRPIKKLFLAISAA